MSENLKQRLLWLRRKAVRCTAGVNYHDDSEAAISSLSITHRWALQLAMIVRRSKLGAASSDLCSKISKSTHTYETRGQRKLLRTFRPTSRSGVVSFTNRAPLLWNSLPDHVRASKTLAAFNLLSPVSLPAYLRFHHMHIAQKLWHWPSAILCVRCILERLLKFVFQVSHSGVNFCNYSI